ncbi:hypothetical protein [Cutibacterium sp. V970]|uniref:hypothetical protein n=1 Tax=Cutibacterium sp. V970 TaxID=3446481 RepID=UPI003EE3DEE7
MTHDLDTTSATVQLTLTSFMIGMAVGQLFVRYILVFSIGVGALFAHVSTSPYVLQQLGLSSKLHAVAFVINSMMIAVSSLVDVRLVRRFHVRNILHRACGTICVTTIVLLLSGVLTLACLALTRRS